MVGDRVGLQEKTSHGGHVDQKDAGSDEQEWEQQQTPTHL